MSEEQSVRAPSGQALVASLPEPVPVSALTGDDPSRDVLDACCGSRMFWFDKADGRALFLDRRQEVCTDPRGREVVIAPDVIGDFTALPFSDDTFSLVVFDPPHTFNGAGSAMAQKYGRLEHGWREQITLGFAECFRVLRPNGTLVFKWNEHRVPVKTVLAMTPEKPLFGHRSGRAAKTHWLVFMKPAQAMSAGTAETPKVAQGEARQRGPKDAPEPSQGQSTPSSEQEE